MSLETNIQEKAAIANLEKAFKKCSELGIKFSVMNSSLMFANKRLYKEAEKFQMAEEKRRPYSGTYPVIAYCQNVSNEDTGVNTHDTMESCGGW